MISNRSNILIRHQQPITIRSPVAEELPRVSNFANHIQIEVGNYQCILVARRLRHELASWIAKVALPVKLTNVPWLLMAHTVDRTNEIAVSNSMGWLFEFPQIL